MAFPLDEDSVLGAVQGSRVTVSFLPEFTIQLLGTNNLAAMPPLLDSLEIKSEAPEAFLSIDAEVGKKL